MTNSLSLTWPISSVLQTKAAIFRFIIVLYIRYLTNHLTSSATSYKFYSSQNELLLEAAVLSTFDEYEMVVQLQVRTMTCFVKDKTQLNINGRCSPILPNNPNHRISDGSLGPDWED
jgi:hypothetical protein